MFSPPRPFCLCVGTQNPTMKKLVLTAWAFAVGLPWAFAGGNYREGVTILFTNDAHTHVDNRKGRGLRYSQIAWLKKACAEKEPTFLVDAGDYLQGTAYGAFDGGEQIVGLMNAAGYDVATVGNRKERLKSNPRQEEC